MSFGRPVALVLVFLALIACTSRKPGFYADKINFLADGISGGTVFFVPLTQNTDKFSGCKTDDGGVMSLTAVVEESDGWRFYFKSTGKIGRAVFSSADGAKLTLYFMNPGIDSDADGFPDAAELDKESDRMAFRKWFIRIAESQYESKTAAWDDKQQDCAGLIRMAYKEALKRHDSDWCRRFGFVPDGNIPDVSKYNYPGVPVIGTSLFRIKNGSPESSFGPFADAASLLLYNTICVGRDISSAEPGDVLFFENRNNMNWPYHTMILAGADNSEYIFIYHTGEGGVVKRAGASYFKNSGAFNPVPENPNYLGIYRFKILE